VAAVVLADSMALMLDLSGEFMVDALAHDFSPGNAVWPAQPGAESLRLLGVDDAGRALLLLPMRGWMIREATSGARTPLGRVAPLPERTPVCLGVTRLWYVDRTGSQVAVVGVPVGDGAPEPRAEWRHVPSAASSRWSPLRPSGGGSGPCVAWHTDHDTLLVLDDRVDSVQVIRVDRAPPPTLWRARTVREFVRRLRAPTPVAFLDGATDHELLALLEPVDSTGTHRIRFVRHSGDSAGVMRVRQRTERLALANDRLYGLAREEHGLRLHWFVRTRLEADTERAALRRELALARSAIDSLRIAASFEGGSAVGDAPVASALIPSWDGGVWLAVWPSAADGYQRRYLVLDRTGRIVRQEVGPAGVRLLRVGPRAVIGMGQHGEDAWRLASLVAAADAPND
jgi:hypothetical protein